MAVTAHDPLDIGSFRKIRLKTNRQGYWEIWWTDAAGGYVTRRESCRTKIWAEAEAYWYAFCQAARAQIEETAPHYTVGELCERWLVHVAPMGKAKIAQYILSRVGKVLGQYTAQDLYRHGELLRGYQRVRGVSNGSIRRELGALKTVLRWAARQKLIESDEVPWFDEVLPPPGPPRTKFLDRGQEQAVWDHAMRWGHGGHRHKFKDESAWRVMLFVALGLETAARRGAILELTWDRVNFEQGVIDYRVPGARVTKKRRVRMPISDRLAPVLEEAWLRAPKGPDGRPTGRVIGGASISLAFARFTRAVGVPWVTPHVLRHTWGSLAAMEGLSLYDISKVMGDTIATVEANYLHLTPDHLRAAVNFKERTKP